MPLVTSKPSFCSVAAMASASLVGLGRWGAYWWSRIADHQGDPALGTRRGIGRRREQDRRRQQRQQEPERARDALLEIPGRRRAARPISEFRIHCRLPPTSASRNICNELQQAA